MPLSKDDLRLTVVNTQLLATLSVTVHQEVHVQTGKMSHHTHLINRSRLCWSLLMNLCLLRYSISHQAIEVIGALLSHVTLYMRHVQL